MIARLQLLCSPSPQESEVLVPQRETAPSEARQWLQEAMEKLIASDSLSAAQLDALTALVSGMQWSIEMDGLIQGLAQGVRKAFMELTILTPPDPPPSSDPLRHYWIQGDCVLITATTVGGAFAAYRQQLARAEIACSQGEHCSALELCRQVNPRKALELLKKQDAEW